MGEALIWLVFELLIVAGIGIPFVIIARVVSKLSWIVLTALYLAWIYGMVWVMQHVEYFRYYFPPTYIGLLVVSLIVAVVCQFLTRRFLSRSTWALIGATVVGFFLGFVLNDPIRTVVLDRIGLGPSNSDLEKISIYPAEGEIELTIPRPYLSNPKDRYLNRRIENDRLLNGNPLSQISLSLCYPSMEPWHFGCHNPQDWRMRIAIPWRRQAAYGKNGLPFNVGLLKQALAMHEYPATESGLRHFYESPSNYRVESGKDYYVPKGNAQFFYECGEFINNCTNGKVCGLSGEGTQCVRTPLTASPVPYSYSMPIANLASWPQVEAKVSDFVSTTLTPHLSLPPAKDAWGG
jgi:hypothetical protein